MPRMFLLGAVALVACALTVTTASAQICGDQLNDWGDAPECFAAYPNGIIGHFPTCFFSPCQPGTQELDPLCPAISSAPGPTGYVRHLTPQGAPHFWLGCYPSPGGGPPTGIDNEPDGKTNIGPAGVSFCAPAPQATPDCVETAPWLPIMQFDQDECSSDTDDHGVQGPLVFATCATGWVNYTVGSCDAFQGFLNVLVDWNEDGDWNDVLPCGAPQQHQPPTCAYEWAVKNAPISFSVGCTNLQSPFFPTGPREGNTWVRVTLTPEPVTDDFPWAGSEGLAGGNQFRGGETEDYPGRIEQPLPTETRSWGRVRATYR